MRWVSWLLLLSVLVACTPQSSGGASPGVVNLPLAVSPAGMRVLVMGDQGTGTPTQARVAQAMRAVCAREGCDLGVGLGDNFYPSGPNSVSSELFLERFSSLYGPLGFPFLMLSGNHDQSFFFGGDGTDARGAEVQVAYAALNPQWVMPARTYRAPLGELVEFFAVDTVPLAASLPPLRVQEWPGRAWDAQQRSWLAESLARSQARWKLVLGHHPLFNNGRHGEAGGYDHQPLPMQRGDAVKTLYSETCGVADALFSGHEHALQVFAPQAECPGTWTFISGAAGRAASRKAGQRPAAYQNYDQPGFLWLNITQERLTVRVYTVNSEGAPSLTFTQEIRKP